MILARPSQLATSRDPSSVGNYLVPLPALLFLISGFSWNICYMRGLICMNVSSRLLHSSPSPSARTFVWPFLPDDANDDGISYNEALAARPNSTSLF